MIIEILPLFKHKIELVQDQYPNTAKPTWINVDNISDIEPIKHFHEYREIDQVYGLIVTRKEFNYYVVKMASGSEIPIGEDEFNKIIGTQKNKIK
jgi:hypothetical protein